MKILILRNCRSPQGEHHPGDSVLVDDRAGEYLIANGYAKAKGAPTPQTAESAGQSEAETATVATPKGRKARR